MKHVELKHQISYWCRPLFELILTNWIIGKICYQCTTILKLLYFCNPGNVWSKIAQNHDSTKIFTLRFFTASNNLRKLHNIMVVTAVSNNCNKLTQLYHYKHIKEWKYHQRFVVYFMFRSVNILELRTKEDWYKAVATKFTWSPPYQCLYMYSVIENNIWLTSVWQILYSLFVLSLLQMVMIACTQHYNCNYHITTVYLLIWVELYTYWQGIVL